MVRVAVLGLIGLLLGLASTGPLARGQPTDPTSTIALAELPTGTLATNQTLHADPFQVTLTLTGLVCAQPATFRVTLTAGPGTPANASSGNPSGGNQSGNGSAVDYTFTPATADFEVPAGQYLTGSTAGGTYQRTVNVTLQVSPRTIPVGGLALPVKVTARLPAGTPASCAAAAAVPEAVRDAEFTINFLRSTEPAPEGPPQKVMPAPGLVGLGLCLVALAALTRRRGFV